MKKFTVLTLTLVLIVFAVIFSANYFLLQSHMNNVMKDDQRNNGVKMSVHFENYINPSIVVFDIKSVSGANSMLDVFRVFLQFADKVQAKKFNIVYLSSRGKTKFKLSGDYFQTLGKEYSFQNPAYTMQTFSQFVMKPDGSLAYTSENGGWLGSMLKELENFKDFHSKWWMEDMEAKS